MELMEIQKRDRNDLSLDGDPIVYELRYGHYLKVWRVGRGIPGWIEKDHYSPKAGDAVLEDYPDGVEVIGVGCFKNREAFLDMMERHFAAELISSVFV